MRELLALTGRHLRTSARSRTSRVAVAVFVLALIAAVLAGRDAPAPSLLLAVATLALTFVAAGFAVGAGTVLPEDRLAGREEWLATLAPPGWKRRLSVVLAAWVIAAGAGLVGGALAGAVTAFVRADALFRAWEVVPLGESRLLDRAAPLEFALPAAPHGYDELEFEIRPLFRDFGRRDVVQIIWASGQQGGTFDASVRGPLRVPVAAKARALTLSTSTEGVRLRVVEARRLGPARAPVPALAWLGLLLGLCVGAVAPVAVLLSRGTTGQTAAAGAGCLL
ncbi:MAG: hypothetical protein O2894_09500, partial [Planctomycetota bacterium]|nr:hypothetical protein [Planctomycetota bacterium]